MMNDMKAMRFLAVLAIGLMSVMSVKAQNQRMLEFQVMMSMHDTTYKNFIKDGKYKEAIAPLTTLINILDTTTISQDTELSPEMIKAAKADYLYDLACCYALTKQKKQALMTLDYLYDLACCYALTKQKKQALMTLEKSVDNGYKRYDNMLNDNDLVSLRKDKKYQALLAMVKDRQPLSVLKKSAPYAPDSIKTDNLFSYESKDSQSLSVVREYFKLDSVAGQGDELSKILNLLHFAHDNMRHDGGNRAYAEMDAIDLYNYCKTTGKGINCRQLAISLCEMYLAMGIPARYVTCMPADPLDYECHVINTVWSEQLQKWLYIDPTMDAWVMDENGTMLSIAEVRERLINDQPLVLCETANWNHENPQTKDYYLDYYMAKNLYYFVCKKYNRFNPESDYRPNPVEEDVRLIPVGFVNDNWKCDTTTDPEVFWAKP